MIKRNWMLPSVGQKLYWAWLLTYILGIPISFTVGRTMTYVIGFAASSDKGWGVGLAVGTLATGALIGSAQWVVLRRKISSIDRWILVSSVGWAAGSAIAVLVNETIFGLIDLALFGSANLAVVWMVSGAVSGAISGAIGGTLVGIAQWLILREKIPRAEQWILASSVSWAASNAIVGIVDLATVGVIGLVLTWMIYGATYGALTGKTWTWLLHRSALGVG